MQFYKMHGCGNDYIYINCFEEQIDNPNALAIKLSDYHKGIGGDGIILILPSKVADVRMRMFNNDGSEGKMCGNGIRCVAKFAYDYHLVNKNVFLVKTLSGLKKCEVFLNDEGKVDTVCVDMGSPILEAPFIPAIGSGKLINQPVLIHGKEYYYTAVSMGNPHMVIYVDDTKSLDLRSIGPYFESCELFPEKVNTEFIRVIDDKTLEMRVYERGTGETLACGTGACAAVVASCLNHKTRMNEEITVKLLGGDLYITYTEDTVMMRGEAVMVFRGEI